MAWTIVDPRPQGKRPLRPDEARLTRSATIILCRSVLDECGIGGAAVVLVDRDTDRVGLRAPEEGEAAMTYKVAPGNSDSRNKHTVEVKLSGAFKLAGWPAGKSMKFKKSVPVVLRAGGADGPPMVILKLGDGKAEED